jgi:hypothetical protein
MNPAWAYISKLEGVLIEVEYGYVTKLLQNTMRCYPRGVKAVRCYISSIDQVIDKTGISIQQAKLCSLNFPAATCT